VIAAAVGRVRTDLARRRAEAARRVPAVLVAHAFVVGGEPSESERDIQVGGVDSVPAGVLAAGGDLDYVALGHLHGPQRVTVPAATSAGARRAGPEVRYAGSPLAYSFSERHHRKSTALVTLDADRPASVRLVPAPVPRRLADVTGALGELLGRAFDEAAGAWVRVVVTDDVRPPDLYGQVVRRFPHALVVQHRPARGAAPAAARDVVAAHDPLEVAAQFVADVGGRCATPDERAGLRAAYEAALAAVAGA
jgi:exonuclease SbcD